MTSEEERIVSIDKRQESFETFVRAYIDSNEKNISEMKADMREMKNKLDNLLIAGGIGLATILASIWGTR